MPNVFSETNHQSWFSRIGNSLKSLIIGGLMFVCSFPLLFWNEGRAVTTARSLNEGEQNTVSVSSDAVDPTNDGKLVHTSGFANTDDMLRDEMFGIEVNAIRLRRIAKMYQWVEKKERESRKKLGGGRETTTTYEYEKEWSSSVINSENFKYPNGHENTASMTIPGKVHTASKVMLDAFQIPANMVADISVSEAVTVSETNIPEAFADQMSFTGASLYLGTDPAAPTIGDIRVTFVATPATDVSILAQQTGSTFQPYQTHAGDALSRLDLGIRSAEQMFAEARHENSVFTWILRGVGTGLMLGGLMMLMSPLAVLGDLIPLVGSIVSGGTFLVSALLTLVMAPTTIAIAWIVYRPLVAVPLLIVAAIALFALIKNRRKEPLPEVITLDDSDFA